MTTATIQALAAATGAQVSAPLPQTEAVSFRLRADGGVTIVTAGGEVLRSMSPDDAPDSMRDECRAKFKTLLVTMTELVPGRRIAAGVTYHRRQVELAEGKFAVIFSEAGR